MIIISFQMFSSDLFFISNSQSINKLSILLSKHSLLKLNTQLYTLTLKIQGELL